MARDYKAEYQARRARAQAAGHSGYRSQRAARASGAEVGGRRQIHKSDAGLIVTTTSGGRGYAVIESQLRKNPTARVRLVVTYTDPDGDEQQANLYGKGGRSAARVLDEWDNIGPDDAIEDAIETDCGSGTGCAVGAIVHVQAVIF